MKLYDKKRKIGLNFIIRPCMKLQMEGGGGIGRLEIEKIILLFVFVDDMGHSKL